MTGLVEFQTVGRYDCFNDFGKPFSRGIVSLTAPPNTHLKAGDAAPDFTLPSTPSGAPVKLSDFRGKKAVVLAFFPAAFTGGCTKEMLAYQAGLAKFEGSEAQVFGIIRHIEEGSIAIDPTGAETACMRLAKPAK